MEENPSTKTKASYMVQQQPAEKKKVERVTTGAVSSHKKSTGKQLREALIGDVDEVKGYLLWDVLVPALKDTVVNLIKNGAEALFYGNVDNRPSHVKRSGPTSYVSYSDYDPSKRVGNYGRKPANGYSSRRSVYDFDDVSFSSRKDAENVLDGLVSLTMNYGVASVADFRDLAGLPINHTDNKYGWGELSQATVIQTRNGYFIQLPTPEPL